MHISCAIANNLIIFYTQKVEMFSDLLLPGCDNELLILELHITHILYNIQHRNAVFCHRSHRLNGLQMWNSNIVLIQMVDYSLLIISVHVHSVWISDAAVCFSIIIIIIVFGEIVLYRILYYNNNYYEFRDLEKWFCVHNRNMIFEFLLRSCITIDTHTVWHLNSISLLIL